MLIFAATIASILAFQVYNHDRLDDPSYQWNEVLVFNDPNKQLLSTLNKFDYYQLHLYLEPVSEIHLNSTSCRAENIACMTPSRPGVVFLATNFLELHLFEQMGTIAHEAAHFIYGHQHVRCTSPLIVNRNCDESMESAFGSELYLYKDLQNILTDDDDSLNELSQLISSTKVRINSLQKNTGQ